MADEKTAKTSRVSATLVETVRFEGQGSETVAGSVMGTRTWRPSSPVWRSASASADFPFSSRKRLLAGKGFERRRA